MKILTKNMLAICILWSTSLPAWADRGGISKKSNKATVSVNIATPVNLKNSIFLHSNKGLKFTGNLLVKKQVSTNAITLNTLSTYQKGNTIYIIPNRQVITIPEIKTNYAGLKLIIKKK